MSAPLRIRDVNGMSVTVGMSTPAGGATTLYSDAACTTSLGTSTTLTVDTTLYVKAAGEYTLSVKVLGVELAGGAVQLVDRQPISFDVDADVQPARIEAGEGAAYFSVVNHGAIAGTARPAGAGRVDWYGSVAPTNAAATDMWWDTANALLKRYTGTLWVASGSGVYALATDAATVEDLWQGRTIVGAVSAAASYPIFTAGQPMSVVAAMLCNWNTDLTQDDTNYWTFALNRYRNNAFATIASLTTKTTASGGVLITRRLGIPWSGANFSAANGALSQGDIVALTVTPTGAPTGLNTFSLDVKVVPA